MAKPGGYRAGAGRRRGAKLLQEQDIQHIVRGVTDFVKIANELYHDYLTNHNTKAAELLLAYGFGKPVQSISNNTHVDITVGFSDKLPSPPDHGSVEVKAIKESVTSDIRDAEFIEIPITEEVKEEKVAVTND